MSNVTPLFPPNPDEPMENQLRKEIALIQAVKYWKDEARPGAERIVETAKVFEDYLKGENPK